MPCPSYLFSFNDVQPPLAFCSQVLDVLEGSIFSPTTLAFRLVADPSIMDFRWVDGGRGPITTYRYKDLFSWEKESLYSRYTCPRDNVVTDGTKQRMRELFCDDLDSALEQTRQGTKETDLSVAIFGSANLFVSPVEDDSVKTWLLREYNPCLNQLRPIVDIRLYYDTSLRPEALVAVHTRGTLFSYNKYKDVMPADWQREIEAMEPRHGDWPHEPNSHLMVELIEGILNNVSFSSMEWSLECETWKMFASPMKRLLEEKYGPSDGL